MKTKSLILLLLITGLALVVTGCTCPRKTAEAPPMVSPCAAPPMAMTSGAYPYEAGSAIRIEKMAPTQARVNEPFKYQIKVTNLTDRDLQNVIVRDAVPSDLVIKSSEPKISAVKEGVAHWMLGNFGPRESQMITINAVAGGKGVFTSCAEVSYDSPICAKIKVVEPQLKLAKSAPSEVLACDRIPLEYVITNTGDCAACGIKVRDKLPQGLMTAEGKQEIFFEVDALEAGKSRMFRAMVDPTKPGVFSSRAFLESGVAGAVESNMTVTKVTKPNLAISQSAPERQYIGRNVRYQITVTNKGDGDAKDSIVELMLPAGIQFKEATKGGVFTHASPGKVQWKLGTLAPNASETLNVVISSDESGALVARSVARAYCADTVTASARTQLAGIPAVLLEVVDVADPIEVGQNETYVITVTNQGSAMDKGIKIICELEDGMEYVSSSGPTQGTLVGNKVEFAPLASLDPRASAVWRVNIRAAGTGDMRFKTTMTTSRLQRTVEETESTNFYK